MRSLSSHRLTRQILMGGALGLATILGALLVVWIFDGKVESPVVVGVGCWVVAVLGAYSYLSSASMTATLMGCLTALELAAAGGEGGPSIRFGEVWPSMALGLGVLLLAGTAGYLVRTGIAPCFGEELRGDS